MAVLKTKTAEADARLTKKDKDVNLPGFTLIREWNFINAGKSEREAEPLLGGRVGRRTT